MFRDSRVHASLLESVVRCVLAQKLTHALQQEMRVLLARGSISEIWNFKEVSMPDWVERSDADSGMHGDLALYDLGLGAGNPLYLYIYSSGANSWPQVDNTP